MILPPLCFIASGNPGKSKEVDQMIREFFPEVHDIRCRAAKHAPETENTFIGNSKIKAHALHNELQSEGLQEYVVFADDSGLSVDALGGAPGVHSARYAGDHVQPEAHIAKILYELKEIGTPFEKRSARYHCAMVACGVLRGQNFEFVSEGRCDGLIALNPSGASGFGYDPVFFSPQLGKTFSEVSFEQKNALSHRREAFKQLQQETRAFRG